MRAHHHSREKGDRRTGQAWTGYAPAEVVLKPTVDLMAVPCPDPPYCQAKVGEPCRTPNDKKTTHAARIRMATRRHNAFNDDGRMSTFFKMDHDERKRARLSAGWTWEMVEKETGLNAAWMRTIESGAYARVMVTEPLVAYMGALVVARERMLMLRNSNHRYVRSGTSRKVICRCGLYPDEHQVQSE